ncbi:hypothetical protein Fot_32196 [Forsythia ovata]|uniref:Uncharacterized protein n=1 Tax=Forsythia ovata TaxID=205694 RepID=A0ABD1T743_9LAMI
MDSADLLDLLKLAEISTSRSHILNCELCKVLAMKIDELYSTVIGAEDMDELRSENKTLRLRFAISEDATAKSKYEIAMVEMIQKLSTKARKQAKLKLKVCEDMAHAKHIELTKALVELSKAKELLVKLGVFGYANPKGPTEP